jgi:hypothetical protein
MSRTKELEEELELLKEKYEILEKKLKIYEKFIPKDKLQFLRGTEEETYITLIQKAFKRKKQTVTFVSSIEKFKNSKLSVGLRHRNQILKELIKTEEDYVNSLKYIPLVNFFRVFLIQVFH